MVSAGALDQALKIANTLFLSLEEQDFRVAHPEQAYGYARRCVDEREQPDEKERYFKHWVPSTPTLVYVGNVSIGLTLFEFSESLEAEYENERYIPVAQRKRSRRYHAWAGHPTHHDFPTGCFCIQAYSPYKNTSWMQRWEISSLVNLKRLANRLAVEKQKT